MGDSRSGWAITRSNMKKANHKASKDTRPEYDFALMR